MMFLSRLVMAFGVLFCSLVLMPTATASSHAHRHRARIAAGTTEIPIVDLYDFQNRYTAFHGWVEDALDKANSTDSKSARAALRAILQSYDGWIKQWLDTHIALGVSTLPPTPYTPLNGNTALSTTLISSTILATTGTRTSTLAMTFKSPANASSGTSSSPKESLKIAMYYGQTAATADTTLAEMCRNTNVDIVVLAFLTHFFGPGGFPTVNFAAACGGQTPKMKSAGAKGLLHCPALALDIKNCQVLGKKVLLILGGGISEVSLPNEAKAISIAKQLWDLFGAGTDVDPGLRPFGNTTLDGFDVDYEDHSTKNYNTFVKTLRQTMNVDKSKKYYISAAPQCPLPDASIPLEAMQTMDFIFLQFYNNPKCNAGTPSFLKFFKDWSAQLFAKAPGPKLYVGLPGCLDCAGSGYLNGSALKSTIADAKAANVSNFGGVSLWDGPMAIANVEGGKDYISRIKEVL